MMNCYQKQLSEEYDDYKKVDCRELKPTSIKTQKSVAILLTVTSVMLSAIACNPVRAMSNKAEGMPVAKKVQTDVKKIGRSYSFSKIQPTLVEQTKKNIAKKKEEEEKSAEQKREQFNGIETVSENSFNQNGIINIHGYQYQISDEERTLLKEVVYAESGGSTPEEQIATCQVILNRVAAKQTTLTAVVFQKGQFACVKNGRVYTGQGATLRLMTPERISDVTNQAVDYVLSGGADITEALLTSEAIRLGLDPNVYATGGALYFCELSLCSQEEQELRQNILCKITIGDHIYYKIWNQ